MSDESESEVATPSSMRVASPHADRASPHAGTARNLTLTAVALVFLVFGLALRSYVPAERILQSCDGRAYYLLAQSWVSTGEFYLDDRHLEEVCRGITAGPSAHYSPGLPLIEGAFILLLGDSNIALALPILLISWGAVLVVWLVTRDLYGPLPAVLAAAAVSLEWTGIFLGTWLGYAENLVLLAIVLTVWAVLRGLRDDRFIVLAGLFASIGYLSKASIGWFFLVAGFGGIAWRVSYRGWGVLRNRWYLLAMLVFAIPVVIWSARNISVFWDGSLASFVDAWQTSRVMSAYIANGLGDPFGLLLGMIGKFPILAVGVGLPFLPFWGTLRVALRRRREEETLGLWITAALIFVLGWFFAAVTWLSEDSNLMWTDPLRYVAPAQVPLLWLVVRERPLPPLRAWLAMFLILVGLMIAGPYLLIDNGPLPD